jgi:ABC-2 type transport system permease protein
MRKYWQIFKVSFNQEFAYRFNFLMWRVRNVIQILVIFSFWNTIFSNSSQAFFGYDRAKILTYVFGILILRAIVLSSRAVDVAGEISSGNLTNLLLKPVNYFKYWFCRDISSKALNIGFSAVEIFLLYLWLKPPLYFQGDPLVLISFLVSLIFAVLLFFVILFLVNIISFFMPENAWAAQFLFIVIILEFFSGGIFPLDILPEFLFKIFSYLPFYYLLFFPLQVYLGKVSQFLIFKGIIIAFFWFMVLSFALLKVWRLGLKAYNAEGR